jgi:hypothetical protein
VHRPSGLPEGDASIDSSLYLREGTGVSTESDFCQSVVFVSGALCLCPEVLVMSTLL